MKKLNIILIILCFILLIFFGICVYYSVTEFQKSEQLYNEAKEYYADNDYSNGNLDWDAIEEKVKEKSHEEYEKIKNSDKPDLDVDWY